MRQFRCLLVLLAMCCVSACAQPAPTRTIRVFAAASLTGAFNVISAEFEKRSGVRVELQFAGSNQLAQQIVQGAAADVFASADTVQMQNLVTAGVVASESVSVFTRNALVLIVPASNPATLTSLADLARPGVKLVLAGANVPAGKYSRELLARAETMGGLPAGFSAAALANVVSNEANVKAVLTKVALGEADAGIVYATDARAESAKVRVLPHPAAAAIIAEYPIAPLAKTQRRSDADAFITFVRSASGQAILTNDGFTAVP